MMTVRLRLVAACDTGFNKRLYFTLNPAHRSRAEPHWPRKPALSHEKVEGRIGEPGTSQNLRLAQERVLEMVGHAGTPSGVVEHDWISSLGGRLWPILPTLKVWQDPKVWQES
ncbi:hypothetical protein J2W25_004603 [Variovorax boronicumulans]|uniref:Uncharacterized protein n=1 Tax=Variovorax boronicumulans TaxID=436515 RepID=A0AAW8E0Z1_9BURK|nr:hypothetical protein [Variovorax boronicumulans]MDP9925560.1 hypothetical protein [Variovorax boronicumulans]